MQIVGNVAITIGWVTIALFAVFSIAASLHKFQIIGFKDTTDLHDTYYFGWGFYLATTILPIALGVGILYVGFVLRGVASMSFSP